ncbi:MAG TPA: Dyp-type peroxidase [Cryobacterium sp.]|nr:Dyp-type peroxidase [Cryobacterium sp.]
MTGDPRQVAPRRLSRRHLLLGGAAAGIGAAGIGAAGAIGIDLAGRAGQTSGQATGTAAPVAGGDTVAFYGTHQAGIETVPQSHVTYLALDLADAVDASALRRMMRILTDDAARLSQGAGALADTEPELAVVPARLTVTFGFGAGLVARTRRPAPHWLKALPPFTIDRLDAAWSDGDLLLQVNSDDPLTVAHATRMLVKDTRSFAAVRWVQSGFRRARGSEKPGTTMRNLFGQVDGTVTLAPGSPDFERLVWGAADNPAWLAGGTGFVLRRIAMNLDKWDGLDRSGREAAVGRRLDTGAPLTGTRETDQPDFDAKTAIGFPVIPEFSHLRRARSDNPDERIFRRGYNYDETPTGATGSNSGLLFASFQADVDRQFVPLQKRLDTLDLLNQWTTPIGSAVFAIPPGCGAGGYIGDTLF